MQKVPPESLQKHMAFSMEVRTGLVSAFALLSQRRPQKEQVEVQLGN